MVAMADEEIARGIQNRAGDGLAITFLSFLDAQWLCFLRFTAFQPVELNGVH